MRRRALLVPAPFVALILLTSPILTGPALASQEGHHAQAKKHSAEHGQHKSKPHKKESTLVGTISATPTATISTPRSDSSTATTSAPSDTATITIAVKGGSREQHGRTVVVTLDKNTVIRRHGPATAADLRKGDHVSVKARRLPNGSWLATRVNASARDDTKERD